ncbi:kinesin motor domain-containing protein [Parasitella parasitica]|nr:kinesin motor domain-containing protein [Parasitella parasitica]
MQSTYSAPSTPTRPATPTQASSRSIATTSRTSNNNSSPTRRQLKETTEVNRYINYDPQKEPIKAFLRIKPKTDGETVVDGPYIQVIDQVEVSMTPPEDSNAYRTRHRASERYRFTKIFREDTDQATFYNETTLALVRDVLQGENALIFAYGVTNSGKTYTVMGKQPQNEHTGLLPRAMSTIFNSIGDRKSEAKIKPVMHSLLQKYDQSADENRHVLQACSTHDNLFMTADKIDIDPNYEYGIWVSFNEIYNEQVYDLLTAATATATAARQKRPQLQLKYEQRTGNKYVADTTLVKIKSMAEADAIMRLGQQNRQVFSTLMNQTSSRSHSIFTVYVVRCPVDTNDFVIEDPYYTSLSKLSIVDLAGSERYRNTNSSGQRLKEAGSINKSLMVLGQCMEVLRLNQIKSDMGKSRTMVPFRHSKLTELFKSTFEGEGKAAIIVNVNPYDTGYDENSHVMKFAAVAKDVTTWKQTHPKLDLQHVQSDAKRLRAGAAQHRQQQQEQQEQQQHGPSSDVEEEDDTDNVIFVNGLIAQLREMREKWVEAETRSTTMESDIREQLSREMYAQFKEMQNKCLLALQGENEMMDLQLQKKGYSDTALLDKLQKRQTSILGELSHLKSKSDEFDATKNDLLDKIAKLEQENQKERDRSNYLQLQLDQFDAKKEEDEGEEDDDDDDQSTTKENDDPEAQQSFESFLSLRKQLRKSIFKKEELCKDADIIMNQVEQFDNVTFKLAKETKMGKLLKLIAQEEFEKDSFQIKSRAMRLFKRYAQLPTSFESLPKNALPSMAVEDTTDIQDLIAENARLKQRIKILNNGQKRLKEAFETTKLTTAMMPPPVEKDDMSMMIDSNDEQEDNGNENSRPTQHVRIANEDFSLKRQTTDESPSFDEEADDSYESDIAEILGQMKRQKRRRKLRAR